MLLYCYRTLNRNQNNNEYELITAQSQYTLHRIRIRVTYLGVYNIIFSRHVRNTLPIIDGTYSYTDNASHGE